MLGPSHVLRLWGFFHCHHDSEKMALEIQSKHTPLVPDSLGWVLHPSKRVEAGAGCRLCTAWTQLSLLWAEPSVWGMAQFGAVKGKYWGLTDGASQEWILWDAPVLCTETTGLEAGTGSRRAQGITRGGC